MCKGQDHNQEQPETPIVCKHFATTGCELLINNWFFWLFLVVILTSAHLIMVCLVFLVGAALGKLDGRSPLNQETTKNH